MCLTVRVAATLALAASFLITGTAVSQQVATPAAQPAEAAKQATKSRSNIQNNREAGPAKGAEETSGAESTEVVKTKTKSNQSND